jgi:hypothetical protein
LAGLQPAIAGRLTAVARDGFQGHVAASLDGPFVVLFEQDCADEANNGVLVGEDADDLGVAFDLAVDALERFVECAGADMAA